MPPSDLCSCHSYPYIISECLHAQSSLTLCNPMDCSPPGPTVHETAQARVLEWVAISYFRESSCPRDRTFVSCIGRWILNHCFTWEAHPYISSLQFSHSAVSNPLPPRGLQHTRPPCPSPAPLLVQTHVHQVSDSVQQCHLCCPLLLPPSVFRSIRVFSNESVLHIRWPKIGVSALASVLPMNIQA